MQTKNVPNTTTTTKAARRMQIECERAAVLHRIFSRLGKNRSERAIASRLAVIARRRHGRPFRCAPDERWRASAKTIIRAYYQWRKGGMTPAAITRHYAACSHRHYRITVDGLCRFIEELSRPGCRSALDAWRRLSGDAHSPRPTVTYSTMLRHLPAGTRRQLAEARASVQDAQASLAEVRGSIARRALGTVAAGILATESGPDWQI